MESFNATDYLVHRHVRDGNGDRTAVICGDRTFTYRALAEEVHRVASGLCSLGVRPEERVAFCMADGIELLAGILAAMQIGAIPVPMSTMVTGDELAAMATDARARVLCASVEFVPAATAAVAVSPEIVHVVLDGELEANWRPDVTVRSWESLRSGLTEWPVYDTWPDSPALWLYTSGTTGTPKGAMHRHASIRDVVECYAVPVLGIVPGDRCLSVPKLFFAYGLGNSCFFPLAAGATTILMRGRPTPDAIAELARAYAPTLFFAVPTFLSALLNSDLPDDTFSSVRQGVSAGEPLPPVVYNRFRERFGVELLDGIGSTEALHIFVSNRAGRVHPGSSGTPVPGYQVEIRDEHGALVTEPGTPGELYVQGSSIATGYWCRTEITRRTFVGEWLRTGDTYVRNEDGTYTCLGRYNDMLKAGGIWVSPAEVEQRLLEHPSVAEAAVVAAPDEFGLDKPVACVVALADAPVDADELIQWCRDGLAAFKRPRAVVAVGELPKTATGKIRRNILRDQVRDVLTIPKESNVTLLP